MQKMLRAGVRGILFSFIFFSVTGFAETNAEKAAVTNAQLGLAYLQKGMYPQSKSALLTSISEDPHIAAGWYSMAYYLEKTGDTRNAKKYYLKAIAVDPHSGEAKNNYGTFLCRAGHEKKGIQQFLLATQEKTYLDTASAFQNAGICSLMMHNKQNAFYFFNRAIKNNPSMPFSLLSLAKLYHENGNDVKAKQYYTDFKELALSNKPQNIIQQYHDYVFGAAKSASTHSQQ